jgi:hypothetical protein
LSEYNKIYITKKIVKTWKVFLLQPTLLIHVINWNSHTQGIRSRPEQWHFEILTYVIFFWTSWLMSLYHKLTWNINKIGRAGRKI